MPPDIPLVIAGVECFDVVLPVLRGQAMVFQQAAVRTEILYKNIVLADSPEEQPVVGAEFCRILQCLQVGIAAAQQGKRLQKPAEDTGPGKQLRIGQCQDAGMQGTHSFLFSIIAPWGVLGYHFRSR